MSPEERQLLQGLFDRMRSASGNTRDREAEAFINDNVRQQPYAPYLLSQTVIVQDQALRAANDRLQQLESELQQMQQGGSAQQPGSGGFLSGIGSLFGGGGAQPQQRSPWNQGGQQQGYPPQGGYAPQPQQGGPWGGQPQQASGGGFLHGALGAAAGVAGGVLLADSIKGLFGGSNNGLGIASGVPGMGGGFGGGGETITNNYYGSDAGGGGTAADYQQDADQDQDDAQDAGDYSSDV
ncbi:DUF2076 domain-containing protein [Beijerinckia sp. L45]|uniref:DUF2076 domain-containing protein n=1 Tax=Beijerinckia sp. L45 TaxID=1641855 RepID=UPI00131C93D3|nr:DUF2076 domain-containing protein [Beijerinckia sp. L45]